jgi:cyclopropane fatty-acyl-phospholipid synthase-like methyltransferase
MTSEVNLKKEIKILELGFGVGGFTELCKELGFTNYLGVELSSQEVDLCSKDYPNYKFVVADVLDFLDNTKEKFDLIFMSQVFEHFTLEEGMKFLKLIPKRLNQEGMFINAMPNANGYFNTPSNRYNDITHKIIYNAQSFSQLLRVLGLNNFLHKNSYQGRNKLENLIHRIYLKFFQIHITLLGYHVWKIYSHVLISIIKRNEDSALNWDGKL